jgi:hypothetical protein
MQDTREVTQTLTQDDEEKPKVGKEAVNLWQERVSLAKQANEDWARKEGAERITQEYNGKFEIFFNGLKGKIPVPPINEIFSFVQSDLAHTNNRDPYISVNPKKKGTVQGAKIWETVLNHDWRHLKIKEELEVEIIDKDLAGYAFHKTGWDVESKGAEEDLKIVKESLYSKRVDWRDIVWNFGAENPPYDCLWMAQRIVKPLSQVKEKYPNANGRWPLKGVQNPEVDKNAYDKATYKDDISVAVLWEIWDKQTRQIFLIAEGLNGKFLEEPRPWPDYMDEFPFLMYWDFYAPTKRRPMSSIISWEPQVHEKMVIMAAAVNHAKRWNRQMLLKKGAISNNDLDKIERGDDGAIIDYTGTGNLNENMQVLDWGSVPTDYYLIMDRLASIQRDVNGQPEFERGGVTKTTSRTEGELQMIQQGADARTNRKIDRFETHIENIARHMLAHRKGNFDYEETIRVTGETPEAVLQALGDHYDPITKMVKFDAKDIEGDYDVEVKAGSTLPLNTQTKKQILQMILKTLASLGGQPLPPTLKIIISEILREYDMKSLEEAFAVEQQQKEQAQAQAAQQQDANDEKARSQAAKNMAQTQKIGVDTEKQMLENVITTHAFETEKIARQAMGAVGQPMGGEQPDGGM